VLEPDLRGDGGAAWPNAREAFQRLDIHSLYAFPLFVGPLSIGVVDLYSDAPRELSRTDVSDVTVLATIAARHVLRRALDGLTDADAGMDTGPSPQREVHQASGMVAAQLGIAVDDALVVLRGHAFASDRTVREVAADVVGRRLVFEP
jgi:hypothetical protein